MSKQQYAWLLALSMLKMQQDRDADQGCPFKFVVESVSGVSGRLKTTNQQAANEAAAALLISFVLLWLSSAIKSAKFVNRCPEFCKLTRREILQPIPVLSPLALRYSSRRVGL